MMRRHLQGRPWDRDRRRNRCAIETADILVQRSIGCCQHFEAIKGNIQKMLESRWATGYNVIAIPLQPILYNQDVIAPRWVPF